MDTLTQQTIANKIVHKPFRALKRSYRFMNKLKKQYEKDKSVNPIHILVKNTPSNMVSDSDMIEFEKRLIFLINKKFNVDDKIDGKYVIDIAFEKQAHEVAAVLSKYWF